MSRETEDHLKAGPISRYIMPITALSIVLMLTVYVLYTELVLEETAPDFAPPVAERALSFRDTDDGNIEVRDARTGEELLVIGEGEEAFMRQTVRQLAQARTRRGGSRDVAFILRGQEDGRLVLEDPVTGRAVDLAAFGEDNAGAFARFLEDEAAGETSDDAEER